MRSSIRRASAVAHVIPIDDTRLAWAANIRNEYGGWCADCEEPTARHHHASQLEPVLNIPSAFLLLLLGDGGRRRIV
jgi:hypothetical protein